MNELTYEALIEALKENRGNEVLAYFEENEEKAIDELLGSLIFTLESIKKNKPKIDLIKYGIDIDKIKPNEYWEEIGESYEMSKIYHRIPKDFDIYLDEEQIEAYEREDKKIREYDALKKDMMFLGYYIFETTLIEYYLYEDKEITFLYEYDPEPTLFQVTVAIEKDTKN